MTHPTATADVAPLEPPTRSGALTEQLHVLVDVPTRCYVMGVAADIAQARGYKYLRQGEVVRDLMLTAIAHAHQDDPLAYAAAVERGRKLIEESASA